MDILAAHEVHLPPSPETDHSTLLSYFGEDALQQSANRRLLTIANYETFQPTALACRHGVSAVAGRNEIAVFPTVSPHRPVVLLNHAAREEPSALAFSTQKHLASARGSGVFIWDVSGGSVSPLMGRLGVQPIHDLIWWNESSVLTVSDASASLWDWKSGKAAMRFGARQGQSYQYAQIASSANQSTNVALMERSGIVRVFDIRTKREKSNFQAFRSIGVGLSYLESRQAWVAWGLDGNGEDAAVKLFSSDQESLTSNDDYWFMESVSQNQAGSSADKGSSPTSSTTGVWHRLLCSGTTPNLACARPCPSPVDGGLLTIGLIPSEDGLIGNYDWQADFWKVKVGSMNRVVSFRQNTDENEDILSLVDSPERLRRVIASEVTVSTYSDDANSGYGLVLCSLTEQGYVLTHSIPEALPAKTTDAVKNKPFNEGRWTSGSKQAIQSPEANLIAKDAARLWGKSSDTPPLIRQASVTFDASKLHDNVLFDIDIPVAYARAAGPVPESSGSAVTNVEGPLAEAGPSDSLDKQAVMRNIQTDKIPCPRFCSASFSFGTGNIVAISNGDVGKLWEWWKQTPSAREPSSGNRIAAVIGNSEGAAGEQLRSQNNDLQYPRTLKDYQRLVKAAQEAQWRENDESDSSSNEPTADMNYFSDDSDGTSDAEEETANVDETSINNPNMYSTYFPPVQATSEKPTAESEQANMAASNDMLHGQAFQNYLSPIVKIQHGQSKIALSSQLIALTRSWDIGSYTEYHVLRFDPMHETTTSIGPNHQQASVSGSNIPLSPLRQPLPSYSSTLRNRETEGKGVHGGEYSARPNVKDSYQFLRKFFAHQQDIPSSPEQSKKARSVPSSPIGKHLVNFEESSTRTRRTSSHTKQQNDITPGVYVRRKAPGLQSRDKLDHIRIICLQNATASDDLKQTDKGDSWRLIASVVEELIRRSSYRELSWREGFNKGALGNGLIDNILRYYEAQGDVQMLASIVCVLRCSRISNGETEEWTFLQDDCERYNSYIRKYSELLHSWGQLTKCAEVKKFLLGDDVKEADPPTLAGKPASDTIEFRFQCPRCASSCEGGANYCQTCQDYALRCSICDLAVRGLFSVCESCGHGGHVDHLKSWFQDNVQCPSGCGCPCKQTLLAAEVHGPIQAT